MRNRLSFQNKGHEEDSVSNPIVNDVLELTTLPLAHVQKKKNQEIRIFISILGSHGFVSLILFPHKQVKIPFNIIKS